MNDDAYDDPRCMVTEAEVLAVLAESDADIAAGRVVTLEDLLEEARESLRRIDANRAGRASMDFRQV